MSVTVYSLPVSQCVRCRGVEIAMRRAEVPHEKVMLNEDATAMSFVKSLGYETAPVVVITDDAGRVVDHFSGVHPDRIKGLRGVA